MAPEHDALAGRLLAGRYRIGTLIASGAMGAVYDGVQENLQRPVAIKVIRPGLIDERFRRRFDVEAHATCRLNHPHIITVHDFGIDGDLPFLVLERLHGETLHDALQTRGRMPIKRGAEILRQIAIALAAAHDEQIVHRDLKPKNVFLAEHNGVGDHVKIVDFGIAKILHADGPRVETTTGVIVGTAGYIAPERLREEGDDPRSDLYALGAIAWDIFAGRPLFSAQTPVALSLKHMMERAPSLLTAVDVPDELASLVSALLEKAPASRPAAASRVADELQHILRTL